MTTMALKHKTTRLSRFADTIRYLVNKIGNLFTLEEVEVTFTKVGDSTRYSYTKIENKHAI